jgi:hypothetical protein
MEMLEELVGASDEPAKVGPSTGYSRPPAKDGHSNGYSRSHRLKPDLTPAKAGLAESTRLWP